MFSHIIYNKLRQNRALIKRFYVKEERESKSTERLFENLAAHMARNRTDVAKWDTNILIILFALLVSVIMLVSLNTDARIVAAIALVGLAVVWLVSWGRGEKLFSHFYTEELTNLKQSSNAEKGTEIEQLTVREKEVLFLVA